VPAKAPPPRTAVACVAIVQVLNTLTGRTFSRRFADSPIRIGSHRTSDLRLQHPAVAHRHGEILFGLFRNLAWTKRTWIDGLRATPGQVLKLTSEAAVTIRPFRVEVFIQPADTQEAGLSGKIVAALDSRLDEVDDELIRIAADLSAPCSPGDLSGDRKSR
jgi:hypothetical protein